MLSIPCSFRSVPSSNTDCAVAIYASHATTIAGSSIGDWGETPLLLNEPSDTVIDKNGTVYVLDALNDRVQRFTRNSMVGTTVVNATNGDELNQLDWRNLFAGIELPRRALHLF